MSRIDFAVHSTLKMRPVDIHLCNPNHVGIGRNAYVRLHAPASGANAASWRPKGKFRRHCGALSEVKGLRQGICDLGGHRQLKGANRVFVVYDRTGS